ncbi:hypothetical protein R5R35_007050 [Gryllus longicercus]|uniref:Cytochrome P450 n=1 Tax=Gryllus longicercus TaxID=2509291 RepID=A0AAN9V2H4_9ORTH
MAILLESFVAELLIGIVTFFLFIYWFLTNNFDYWEKRNVFYLKPIPLFGNFKDRLLFRKTNSQVSKELYDEAKGQKIFGTWMFKLPFLWIRDPEIIKRILVKDFAHFHDRGIAMDEEKNPLSANLFNLPGARWRALRTKLTPTFTSGKMKMMFGLMHECAREFVDFVRVEADANGEVEFKEVFAKLTTDIIGSCAFGLQFNSMKNPDSEFRKMGVKFLRRCECGDDNHTAVYVSGDRKVFQYAITHKGSKRFLYEGCIGHGGVSRKEQC